MDDEEDHITEAMRECRLAIEGTNGGTDIIYWSPQNPPCHEYPAPPASLTHSMQPLCRIEMHRMTSGRSHCATIVSDRNGWNESGVGWCHD